MRTAELSSGDWLAMHRVRGCNCCFAIFVRHLCSVTQISKICIQKLELFAQSDSKFRIDNSELLLSRIRFYCVTVLQVLQSLIAITEICSQRKDELLIFSKVELCSLICRKSALIIYYMIICYFSSKNWYYRSEYLLWEL